MLSQEPVDIPDDEQLIMTSSHLELSLYGHKKSGFFDVSLIFKDLFVKES
jgi:hypothetical protein